MAERSYGQYCGLSRALDLVGERWALLLIRDLLVAPTRFSDLRRSLPKIPSNVLSARLKELEEAGVVHREARRRPEGGVVYQLTPYGRELEDAVLRLGRWGAASLGQPRPGEILTVGSVVLALRAMFHPDAAAGVTANFQLDLDVGSVHARVVDGSLVTDLGPIPNPDLTIATGIDGIGALLTGTSEAREAVAHGTVRLSGDPDLLITFTRMFRIGAASAGHTGR